MAMGLSVGEGDGAWGWEVKKTKMAARAMSPRAAIAHLLTSPMTLFGGILPSPDTPAIIPLLGDDVNSAKDVLKESRIYGIMIYK